LRRQLPIWLTLKAPDFDVISTTKGLLDGLGLHTICESAICPNMVECFSRKTATFLILGDVCTRNCTFCAVKKGKPKPPDLLEPEKIANAVDKLGLRYVVVTSVTRDDLLDGGANHFAQVIRAIRHCNCKINVEVLIPDFRGSTSALQKIVQACPVVLNHNLETVPRLYPKVRPEADYQRSLDLLSEAKLLNPKVITKSGIMLGLGETRQEVIEVMTDLRKVNCVLLTIGQYLQPSSKHHEVFRLITPEEFYEYKEIGRELGFTSVVAGPLVRSSLHAAETYLLASEGKAEEDTT